MKNKIISIAIADDHSLYRTGLANLLQTADGLSVTIEACNGRELIDKLSISASLPDLCILDLNMPVLNGYDTIAVLKKRWPAMKVLVLSMHSHEYSIIKMMRAGANSYLLKSCEPPELFNAVRSIKATGYYHSKTLIPLAEHIFQNEKTIPNLTEKEVAFLKYCCQDLDYKAIAEIMDVGVRTVDGYRDNLFKKLGANSRMGLALFAINSGLVNTND